VSYIINKSNGDPLVNLQDGTLDTSTSVGLLGRNYVGYGEVQNENFLHLLENFANKNPPSRPLPGQTWFNTDNNLLNVYDGVKWVIVGSAQLSDNFPNDPPVGALWLKTPDKVLYVWDGVEWKFIGPETAEGFGVTRAKSTIMQDSLGGLRPVIQFVVNDIILAIVSSTEFTLPSSPVTPGFSNISIGINLNNLAIVRGNLLGKSQRADRLDIARSINGIPFDGTSNITIRSSTTRFLNKGNYLIGNNFDGSSETTWSVDATPNNLLGTIVARDSAGDFSAGTISANLIGNVTGNVTITSGTSTFNTVIAERFIGATLSGNSFSATKLETARSINGVFFDGTNNITITAEANTLTGNNLSNSVIFSNLSQVGTLTNLNVTNQGINVGTQFKISVDQGIPTVENPALDQSLKLQIKDLNAPGVNTGISLIPASVSLSAGGENSTSLIPNLNDQINLGHTQYKFKNIYSAKVFSAEFIGNLLGNATTSTESTLATNLKGGSPGSIVFQATANTTAFLQPSSPGQFLTSTGISTPIWKTVLPVPSAGTDISIIPNTSNDINDYTISVQSTSSNIAEKIVARDSNGDFSARFINASLIGTPTAPTPPDGDNSTRIATTEFVRNLTRSYYAGVTTLANVAATYANFPAGTRVSFLQLRDYFAPANSNGGSAYITEYYRRVVQKQDSGTWLEV
jgi:hypothetical protein